MKDEKLGEKYWSLFLKNEKLRKKNFAINYGFNYHFQGSDEDFETRNVKQINYQAVAQEYFKLAGEILGKDMVMKRLEALRGGKTK